MKSIVITGGRIIDGVHPDPIENSVIYVKDGKIEEIADSRKNFPLEAERIDASGMTVLPGLIDAHIHLAFSPTVAPGASPAIKVMRRFTALPSS